MTVFDNTLDRIVELEGLLGVSEQNCRDLRRSVESYSHDGAMLTAMLNYTLNIGSPYSPNEMVEMVEYLAEDATKDSVQDYQDILTKHALVSSDVFVENYEVTICIPASIIVQVAARNSDHAEECALQELEESGPEGFDPEFDIYDARVTNVEEV